MFLQNKDESVEAHFILHQKNNETRTLSGLISNFKEEKSFRIESCDSGKDESCYLWMEVAVDKR